MKTESDSERINRIAYDRMAQQGHVLATPVRADELAKPLEVVDGRGWLGGCIRGWNVLCLAAGGGRHSALYSAAGAKVTVVDISEGMLNLDRQICEQYQFDVRLIRASMNSMPMLKDEEFDLVVHPVSTCYLPEIRSVFQEVSRLLVPNGLYISQHKNPANLQTSLYAEGGKYYFETRCGAIAKPVTTPHPLRESHTQEYAHALETILGGICRAGLAIEDLSEPEHSKLDSPLNSVSNRSLFIPPYIRIKARKSNLGLPQVRDANIPSRRALILPTDL